VPPCASISFRTIDRPSPLPPVGRDQRRRRVDRQHHPGSVGRRGEGVGDRRQQIGQVDRLRMQPQLARISGALPAAVYPAMRAARLAATEAPAAP
jgi:hypothetical protein